MVDTFYALYCELSNCLKKQREKYLSHDKELKLQKKISSCPSKLTKESVLQSLH